MKTLSRIFLSLLTYSFLLGVITSCEEEKPCDYNQTIQASDQRFKVAENTKEGNTIGIISSETKDSIKVNYYMVKNHLSNIFTIEETTGQIILNDSVQLNYTEQNTYSFEVLITDANRQEEIAIVINVTIEVFLDLSEGLIAHYPFNADAKDISGYERHGTVNGAKLSEDRFGNENSAYSFTGGQFIEASPEGLPDSNSARSISIWVKPDDIPDADVPICWGRNQYNKGYVISMGNQVAYPEGFRHAGWNNDIQFAYEVPDSSWFHIATTYDGENGLFYLNGEMIKKGTKKWDTQLDKFWIGKNLSENPTDHFEGLIDDIRVYNRVLSANEVKALYEE